MLRHYSKQKWLVMFNVSETCPNRETFRKARYAPYPTPASAGTLNPKPAHCWWIFQYLLQWILKHNPNELLLKRENTRYKEETLLGQWVID